MFVLMVRLKNAEEVAEFKRRMIKYDHIVTIVVDGYVVTRPMIVSSPYIMPLDKIAIHFNGKSINEFMDMVYDLDQFILEEQNDTTKCVIKTLHENMLCWC